MSEFIGTATPLSQSVFDGSCATLGATKEALWAVLSVETSGCGFLADRRPKILFERHIFHRLTGGRFDSEDPDVSAPTAGGYGAGGAHQYLRLEAAMQLDRDAAFKSASWGLGQILGENFARAGYATAADMVAAFVASEDEQLGGMAKFIASGSMMSAIASKRWAVFARLYNGPNYAANNYDGHLEHFCGLYESRGCPDVVYRAVQILLTFRGYAVGGVDGIIGRQTTLALSRYCADAGLQEGSTIPQILASLQTSI